MFSLSKHTFNTFNQLTYAAHKSPTTHTLSLSQRPTLLSLHWLTAFTGNYMSLATLYHWRCSLFWVALFPSSSWPRVSIWLPELSRAYTHNTTHITPVWIMLQHISQCMMLYYFDRYIYVMNDKLTCIIFVWGDDKGKGNCETEYQQTPTVAFPKQWLFSKQQ